VDIFLGHSVGLRCTSYSVCIGYMRSVP